MTVPAHSPEEAEELAYELLDPFDADDVTEDEDADPVECDECDFDEDDYE